MNIYLYHLTQDNIVKYVGLTQQLARTKTRHRKEKPSHQFVIVETYHNREEAGIAEQYHIAAHKTHKKYGGWNKTIGGDRYLDWVDRSGENNGNWKGGITYDMVSYNLRPERKERRKELDRKRKQTPERKEYDRIRNQRPEVKERKNMLRKIRYARNREIEYFMLNGLVL